MIVFISIEEFESTAKELYDSWLSTETPIGYRGVVPDWLSLSTYILGLAYYGIALYSHFSEKKGKEELLSYTVRIFFHFKATNENKLVDKFQNDAERLKEAVKGKALDLDASVNLEQFKENISNDIYNIMKGKNDVNRDAIEDVVNYVVNFLNAKSP